MSNPNHDEHGRFASGEAARAILKKELGHSRVRSQSRSNRHQRTAGAARVIGEKNARLKHGAAEQRGKRTGTNPHLADQIRHQTANLNSLQNELRHARVSTQRDQIEYHISQQKEYLAAMKKAPKMKPVRTPSRKTASRFRRR